MRRDITPYGRWYRGEVTIKPLETVEDVLRQEKLSWKTFLVELPAVPRSDGDTMVRTAQLLLQGRVRVVEMTELERPAPRFDAGGVLVHPKAKWRLAFTATISELEWKVTDCDGSKRLNYGNFSTWMAAIRALGGTVTEAP